MNLFPQKGRAQNSQTLKERASKIPLPAMSIEITMALRWWILERWFFLSLELARNFKPTLMLSVSKWTLKASSTTVDALLLISQ